MMLSNRVCVAAGMMCVCSFAMAQHQDLLYVLQPDNISVEQLANSDVDWLILEPTKEGSQDTAFTAAEIEQIRSNGACPKKVLAYLSVGEAESYRDYFDPAWIDGNDNPVPGVAPDWLGATNPDWEGNYKVRYWMPDWQHLIIGTDDGPHVSPLDAILDAGFDGVYLDIIDAYYYWSSPDDGVVERPRMQARDEMIAMVEEIARHTRVVRGDPDFMVFPQGGSDIIRDDNDAFDIRTDDYFASINGIGREDVWYSELTPQDEDETNYTLEQLREYKSRGGTVLITDYLIKRSNQSASQNNARATDFRQHAAEEGFIGYGAFNDRALDKIVTFSGNNWTVEQPEPGCPVLCIADFNGDGSLDFFDISGFLAAYSERNPQADFTHDGNFDFFDISAFLTAYSAGCP